MTMNIPEDRPNVLLVLSFVFIAIVVAAIVDLALDAPESWLSLHVLVELVLITLSLGAALYFGRGWLESQASVGRLERLLTERQAERDAWRGNTERLLEGLARAIDDQLRTWGLSDAERETALMLLKGYSHKRIARLTSRSERTVRQHAVAVYRKSGLAGRAELAGFLLEGLATPASYSRRQ